MDINVDANRTIPKHQLIAADLANKINNGIYPEGSLLPGEFELAKIYSASRNTIRTALSTLERTFRIKRVQGKGTIVLARLDPTNQSFAASRGFSNYLRNNYGDGQNNEVHTKTVAKRFLPCPEKYRGSFPPGVGDGEVLLYERLYYVNDEPTALIISYIQNKDLPMIEQYDFEMMSLATIVRTRGIEFLYRHGHFKAVLAGEELGQLLDVPPSHPLIRYDSESFGANMPGQPTLEVGTIYLKTDNVAFIVDWFH